MRLSGRGEWVGRVRWEGWEKVGQGRSYGNEEGCGGRAAQKGREGLEWTIGM